MDDFGNYLMAQAEKEYAGAFRDGTPRDTVCHCGMQEGPKAKNHTCSQCGYMFPQNNGLSGSRYAPNAGWACPRPGQQQQQGKGEKL